LAAPKVPGVYQQANDPLHNPNHRKK